MTFPPQNVPHLPSPPTLSAIFAASVRVASIKLHHLIAILKGTIQIPVHFSLSQSLRFGFSGSLSHTPSNSSVAHFILAYTQALGSISGFDIDSAILHELVAHHSSVLSRAVAVGETFGCSSPTTVRSHLDDSDPTSLCPHSRDYQASIFSSILGSAKTIADVQDSDPSIADCRLPLHLKLSLFHF